MNSVKLWDTEESNTDHPLTPSISRPTRQTDPTVKVRKASAFMDEVAAQFSPAHRSVTLDDLDQAAQRPAVTSWEVTVWSGYNGIASRCFTGQVATTSRLAPARDDGFVRMLPAQPSPAWSGRHGRLPSLPRMQPDRFGKVVGRGACGCSITLAGLLPTNAVPVIR